jgi:hypothetical protein
VAEGSALLGAAVHRTQQRIDIDVRLLADTRKDRGLLGQGDQVPAQHRRQLPGMPVGELPQEDPQRGARVDAAEYPFHPTGPHDIQIVDAVRPSGYPGDDRGQLRSRVRRPGLHPLINEPDVLVKQTR